MRTLNLDTPSTEHKILKDYLENNVSETLADKINNGVKIEKDGLVLVNKKDLNTFLSYASNEAQKQVEKGAKFACIDHATVFSWAIHYFEEDSIEGKLYNEDGTENKQSKPVYNGAKTTTPIAAPVPKPKPQMSMFDLMNPKVDEAIKIETQTTEESPIDDDETIDEILSIKSTAATEPVQATSPPEQDAIIAPSPLQVDEDKFVDEDGVVHNNYIPPLLDEQAITNTPAITTIPPSTTSPTNTTFSATTTSVNPTLPTAPSTATPTISSNSSNEIVRWLYSIFGDNVKVVL